MKTLAGLLLVGLLMGCGGGPLMPISTGSHSKQNPWGFKTDRYIVWADDPQIAQYLTGQLLAWGFTVVERVRLDALFAEQRVTLVHASDANVLKIGKLAGATNVVFADTQIVPPRSGYESQGYAVSATVRNVVIETGEVKWSGTGSFAERASNPQGAALYAAELAYIHAACPFEDGYLIVRETGGCQKANSHSENGGSP